MELQQILFLKPNRVWRTYLGGRLLDEMEGKPQPTDGHFPEDWIASTTRAINKGREHFGREGLSSVEVEGREWLLSELFARFPNETLGPDHVRAFGPTSQFLFKLLDASVRLQIQCHPTIDFAKAHLNSRSGKTEAYVILKTREDVAQPFIYLGFQRPPDPKEFRRAIVEQDIPFILSCFDQIPVRAGDVFVVPGGVPHAIGAGVFMIEIMEPTDLVARIEFECGGYVLPEAARFMGRDVDFGLSMFQFEAASPGEVRRRFFQSPSLARQDAGGAQYTLIGERATPCFRVERIEVHGIFEMKKNSFCGAIVTSGAGRVRAGAFARDIKSGDRFVIPFQTNDVRFESGAKMEIVCAFPPKPPAA